MNLCKLQNQNYNLLSQLRNPVFGQRLQKTGADISFLTLMSSQDQKLQF